AAGGSQLSGIHLRPWPPALRRRAIASRRAPTARHCGRCRTTNDRTTCVKYTTIAVMADTCGPTPPSPPVANKSGRKVFCAKFQKELAGLDAPPWPGEL